MKELIKIQKNEISEYYVYRKLGEWVKDEKNKKILFHIADEELEHYNIIKEITQKEVSPSKFKIFFYTTISKVCGLNFGLKLMEINESGAQKIYDKIDNLRLKKLIESEKEHEKHLISMIDENILKYVSSIILGMNDAIVELTGALTGFTFAFSNPRIVAIAGFITGFAASLSMGISNYLSIKNEPEDKKHPVKSAIYTFNAYLFTVILIIIPYLIFSYIYYSFASVIILVVLIIAFFNFYISVARSVSFKKRFIEMIILSMSAAIINYVVGYLIKINFNIDI